MFIIAPIELLITILFLAIAVFLVLILPWWLWLVPVAAFVAGMAEVLVRGRKEEAEDARA